MDIHSISSINQLPDEQKRSIYSRFVPEELLRQFDMRPDLYDDQGRSLLRLSAEPGSTDVEFELRHEVDARDPLLYAHLTDTISGQIHVLLYIVNDPEAERFHIDRMPDGSPTRFGLRSRNIPEEIAAMEAGLAPGQVRSGLRLTPHAIAAFLGFITSLGHDRFFVDPLFYHNAITFERYGLRYQVGLRRMEAIHQAFQPEGEFWRRLNGSSPFRKPEYAQSIRGRSWALHDGIAGQPYSEVTMYFDIGRPGSINTFPDGKW